MKWQIKTDRQVYHVVGKLEALVSALRRLRLNREDVLQLRKL